MSTTEDERLLEAWQAGDSEAGNALFERYFDTLYRFFLHKKVEGDAMDLLQHTLLACVEGLQRYKGHSSVRTYLFAIARHKLHDYWRTKTKRDNLDFSTSSLFDLGPSPSSVVRHRREHRLLLEALRRLPLDQQIAVELHYFEGLSGPEIGEVLEIPANTVRGRLHRAREELRHGVRTLAREPATVPEDLEAFDRWAEALGWVS